MIKYFLVLFLIAGNAYLFPQEISRQQLDRMFNDFMKIRNAKSVNKASTADEFIKCGFSQVNSVRQNFNSFTPDQQQILKPLLARPDLQTSIASPSGFFRIHYDTTGDNIPGFNIDSVAIAADSAFNFEVNYLGYQPPPLDNGAGGDDKYDIYIENLVQLGEYGETDFEFVSGDKGPSYMIVNSDFSNFPTKGINAVRVTIAHEFHHGIQGGNYIFRSEDAWFHELTSTSMEEFVYNTVNDYYFYQKNYFNNPNRSIAENDVGGGDGYDLAIWNIFQKDKFGFGIIKREWELMPAQRAITCINQSITENNISFSQVLNEFGVWVYFTGSRAVPGKYFSEAKNYPLIKFPVGNPVVTFSPPSDTINNVNYPVSNNFFKITYTQPALTDDIISVITNSDVTSAINSTGTSFPFKYFIYNYPVIGSNNMLDRYYAKLVASGGPWFNSEVLNGTWLGSEKVFNTDADFPFPSPFNYGYSYMYVPVDQSADNVQLNVFTVSMTNVFSSNIPVSKLNNVKKVVKWNGKGNNQQKLSSGIYIVAVKNGNNVKTYKIAILNE